jgi:hypothetical protein
MIMLKKYNKRFLLLFLLVWPAVLVSGQFNITMVPAGTLYLRSQLWNLSITNGGTLREARIHMDFKDEGGRQVLFSALTASFRLGPGATVLQAQGLEPISYINGTEVVDQSPNGMLPAGKYQVCYELVITSGETYGPVAETCEDVEVEPLSPPVLIMPEDDSTVMTAYPDFTWMPPGPPAMFTDLRSDLLISPVYEGQASTDAIQKNLPVQQAQGLQQPYFTFPIQGPQLEVGKTYAWQVIARNGQQFAAKSDVWTFKMPDAKTLAADNSLVYLQVDDRSGGIAATSAGLLHIKFVSSLATYQGVVVFRDENGGILETLQRQIHPGDNWLQISLSGRFQPKHTYTVTIGGPPGQLASMKFGVR